MLFKQIVFLLILIGTYPVVSLTQGTTETMRMYSENKEYVLEVTGNIWEGFPQNTTWSFYSQQKRTLLWEKTEMNTGEPLLSNLGEIAIPQQHEILFYDQVGGTQRRFAPISHTPLFIDPYMSTICDQYTLDGLYYMVFTRHNETEIVMLWSLDSAKNSIWNVDFGYYAPRHIYNISQNRLLIEGHVIENYQSKVERTQKVLWYLLDNQTGEIIQRYEFVPPSSTHFYHPREVISLKESHEFLLFNYGINTRYFATTGKRNQEIEQSEILSWCFDSRLEKILIALYNLNYQIKEEAFSELSQEMIEQLYHINLATEVGYMSYIEGGFYSLVGEVNGLCKAILGDLHLDILYYRDSKPYTGKTTTFYMDGSIQEERFYDRGQLTHFIGWFKNGNKQREYHYHNMKLSSFTEWTEYGKVLESF